MARMPTSYNDFGAFFFGVIVIAAIFGTSILRDFQRDTYPDIFTKPVSKFAYLGAAGPVLSLQRYCFFRDDARDIDWHLGSMGRSHAHWSQPSLVVLQPFLSIIVGQIFFVGSLFFVVAALTRKIFIVYLQGVALFMLYLIGITVFSATRSLEHFWSGILDPVGLILFDNVSRSGR